MSRNKSPFGKMALVDPATNKQKGYKATIRMLRAEIQSLFETVNLAVAEAKFATREGETLRDIVQLIVLMGDEAHGFRLRCGCDPCKAIVEELQGLAKHDIRGSAGGNRETVPYQYPLVELISDKKTRSVS